MAYVKYKEISKYFYFSKVFDIKKLPNYVKDYIYEKEEVLVAYKTLRDHGVFTDKKIVLFDNKIIGSGTREIFTIPYSTISTCSVIFKRDAGELVLFLNSGYPLRLKFIKMNAIDKLRLRLLYNCVCKVITSQNLNKEEIIKLQTNDLKFE